MKFMAEIILETYIKGCTNSQIENNDRFLSLLLLNMYQPIKQRKHWRESNIKLRLMSNRGWQAND